MIEPCPVGLLWDMSQKPTRAQALGLRAMGFLGGFRYVGFGSNPVGEDLDADELAMHLDAGSGIMVVQHCPEPGWRPSLALGTEHGQEGLKRAQACGYEAGAHFWNDLEGVLGSASDTASYEHGKIGEVSAAYPLGNYIGAGVPMTSVQLFDLLMGACYWQAFNVHEDVDVRGYAVLQLAGDVAIPSLGVTIDVNLVRGDRKGGRPMWMVKG